MRVKCKHSHNSIGISETLKERKKEKKLPWLRSPQADESQSRTVTSVLHWLKSHPKKIQPRKKKLKKSDFESKKTLVLSMKKTTKRRGESVWNCSRVPGIKGENK